MYDVDHLHCFALHSFVSDMTKPVAAGSQWCNCNETDCVAQCTFPYELVVSLSSTSYITSSDAEAAAKQMSLIYKRTYARIYLCATGAPWANGWLGLQRCCHLGTQMWMLLSSEADANMLCTTGFHATALTVPVCPSSCSSRSPLLRCHTYTLHSSEPLSTKPWFTPPKHARMSQCPVRPDGCAPSYVCRGSKGISLSPFKSVGTSVSRILPSDRYTSRWLASAETVVHMMETSQRRVASAGPSS
mmetsp:Transcript_11197/g.33585  ORF Transcript_11197/g.33585 Transcript_11197/m.33585 type:complete len:245 (-) Transcript_11197:1605-2339(-)